jgi:amidase
MSETIEMTQTIPGNNQSVPPAMGSRPGIEQLPRITTLFKQLFPVLLIAVVLLAACLPGELTPAPAPTQAPPTAAPTEETAVNQVAAPEAAAPAQAPLAPATAPEQSPRLRQLDFAPFEKELAAFTPERAAAVDAIVKDADIAQVQDAVKAGKLTYAELTLYFLARIQKYDETLRTMIELNPDALKEAQAADQRLKEGKATGLMLGIPVTLKDNIETAAPMHTTGGAEILLNNQPKADASFVKQLREAGAVILGKANLSELAGGVSNQAGFSAVGGQVVNPHGNYSPAGSSAGSGAGTAAYETMVSVGSETSGSLIAPASWNGVVGMYPGHGVVDGANVIPLIKNNDSAGPIGRSVKDVAALLGVIDTMDTDYVAGLDAKALNGINAAFLKSEVLAEKPNELEDNSDNAAIAQLIEKSLTEAGAKVTDIELTPAGIVQQIRAYFGVVLVGGVFHDMVPYLVDAGAPVKTLADLAAYNLAEPKIRIPTGQGTIDAGLNVPGLDNPKDYRDAVAQVKELTTAALDAAFADNKTDVLVSVNNYHSQFYATSNYPAISVPLGLRKNGMPVGVTLIGKPGSEAKLLSYAYAFEQATKLRVNPSLTQAPAEAAPTTTAVTTGAFGGAWESVSCDTFKLPKDVAESSDCGYVTVPEEHANPDGPTIQLAAVRIRSIGDNPAPEPLFMEQGGPGGSTIDYFPSVIGKLLPILKTRDVVLVEQRGTRHSMPSLYCPEEHEHKVAVLKGEASKDDFSYMEACKARMEKEANLSAFNTRQNAADMYAVAEALGYDQFNYYGVSYGTLLGQYVMNQAAEHPGMLRSVILDSVVPINVDTDLLKGETASRAMREFFAACAQNAVCSRDFPDLESKVLDFADRLNERPAEITVTLPDGEKVKTTFDGNDLTTLIFNSLYATQKIMMLPAQLDALINQSDFSWVEASRSAEFKPGTTANGMHLTMKCPRHNNVPDKNLDLFEPAYPEVTFVAGELESYDKRCAIMAVPSDAVDEYVFPTADIPTLLLSGQFDPATPPEFAEHVATNLKTANAFTMPDSGHDVLLNSPTQCAAGIALQFLADPTQAPDGSCAADLKPAFLGRVTPVEELTLAERDAGNGITAMIPSQWASAGGLFLDPNDPLNSPTGALQITVEPGESAEGAIKANSGGAFAGAKVIAADQPLGAYKWTTVETDVVPGKTTRVGAALLPDGESVVMVKLFMPVGQSGPIVAKLWEPILSGVKVNTQQ